MLRKLLLIWLCLLAPVFGEGPPRVFAPLDFATAQTQAKEQGRWLLVDATAVWCPPCHKMDATTWIDPALEAYFAKDVLAIQIDVDQQAELSEKLGINAMPTVIVFGPEGELDRSVGYKTAEELLAWLTDLRQGITQADRLREKSATGDIESRYDLAEKLLETDKLEEAAKLYLALWEDMRDTEWVGVRCSYMLSSIGALTEQSPAAKEQFERVREQAWSKGDFEDWFYLSKTLGHDEELLAWEPVKPVVPALQKFYFDFLIEHDRWAKAGNLLDDPEQEAKNALRLREALIASFPAGDDSRQEMVEYAQDSTRSTMLSLYAACLAAGKGEQAQAVRRIAVEDDASLQADFEALDAQPPTSKP